MSDDKWESFAKKDAEFYIYSVDVDYSTEEGQKYFFESGRTDVAKFLAEAGDLIGKWGTALEIGCGTGRLALAMAEKFEEVVGVDIAPTMIHKLQENAEKFAATNVRGRLATDRWETEIKADFVYSYLVFQHIEDFQVIADYFSRIHSALAEGGLVYAQFDTRAKAFSYQIRKAIPDPFLPRAQRRGIRRTRRTREELATLFSRSGFKVARELRPDSDDNAFVLTRG